MIVLLLLLLLLIEGLLRVAFASMLRLTGMMKCLCKDIWRQIRIATVETAL